MITESEKLKIAIEALLSIVNWHLFRWSKAAGIAAEALSKIEGDNL